MWVFVAVIVVGWLVAMRATDTTPTRRQRAAWLVGVAFLWVASDWPIGTLGSGYLASAHMAQYFLYTFVAAPLLVLGLPEGFVRGLLDRFRLHNAYRVVTRPLVAGLAANVVLIGTHAPVAVDTFRATQFGSFALDIAWLIGGLVMWLPVCGPIEEAKASYPIRCIYLFLAAGLIPMVPGGFLTFADNPLYSTYELAPRVGTIDPVNDQQFAGALMKIGNLPLIWPVMTVMFWRWAKAENDPDTPVAAAEAPVETVDR